MMIRKRAKLYATMEAYNISPDFGLLQSHHCQVDPATGAIKEQRS